MYPITKKIILTEQRAYVSPLPEIIRKKGNHLINESSLYLRQHAFNPVDWYPWSEEAFKRAKNEDKPIFLSIGYSSCHWCHVMEEQVFEHDSIAIFLNEHFINIKVDREERPDLDSVYMQAVQMLTGGGGWPMSVFLTPDLKPFYGGTYFPMESFSSLITQINRIYYSDRDKVSLQSEELYKRIASQLQTSDNSFITKDEIETIVNNSLKMVDWKWGGFRSHMKFPTPLRWHFLLHYYRLTGNEELGNAIRLTLDQMASGGIFDHIAGGFHRYTVDNIWLVPHFEKMLYDNAQLASLYLEVAAVFKDETYSNVAEKTLDFMIDEMSQNGDAFYSSYDADSGGDEGSFYTWTIDELKEIAGERNGRALALLLGVNERGNFAGRNVLTRRKEISEVAKELNRDREEIEDLFELYREKLNKKRERREKPNLDKKVVTSWNGLAISALSQAYRQLGKKRYLKAAKEAADRLLQLHKNEDGSLFRTSTSGKLIGNGILDDYAFLANGLLDLFQTDFELNYLKEGLALLDYVKNKFRNPEGAYFLTPEGTETPVGRQVEVNDAVEPSGNSVLMKAFLKASALTGDQAYRKEAERVVTYYSDPMFRAGMEMGNWLDVANMMVNPFYEIIIMGSTDKGKGKDFAGILKSFSPFYSTVVFVPANNPEKELLEVMPSLRGKTAIDGEATVYICEYGNCQAPINEPEKLKSLIKENWKI